MPYPSSFGAFASGLSSSMNAGMQAYMQGAMKQIDREERKAIAAGQMSFKIFTDENLPVEVRKRAYSAWRQGNKDWNTGIQAPDFPDDYWEGKQLTPYFKKGQAILKNKDYTTQEKMEFLRGLEVEAIDAFGADATKAFKPMQEQIQQERKAALFRPTTETIPGIPPTQYQPQVGQPLAMPGIPETRIQAPSPVARATGIAGRGAEMGALLQADVPFAQALGAIKPEVPKKWVPKTRVEALAFERAKKGIKPLPKEATPAGKETRAEHFIRNYGPTRDKFDRIIEIMPKQRLPRLKGWLRTREIETKKGVFSTDELNQIEQSIMTGLRIEPQVQDSINLLRDQGATAAELRMLLEEYLKGK